MAARSAVVPQSGHSPELTKAGGFRLDDPAGEVGIEFLFVTDGSGERAATYQVPLTYRGSACASAGDGLIGTAEHGVLGRRWVYDGTHDPVLVAQLVALIQGESESQAQSPSNTPDRTVISQPVKNGHLEVLESAIAANGPERTDLRITVADAHGTRGDDLLVRVIRVLQHDNDGKVRDRAQGHVSAAWRLPDSTLVRGLLATAQ